MIEPIGEAHDWGTGYLFPSFGMATLPGVMMADLKVKTFADKISL
jgi:hypothetical protein